MRRRYALSAYFRQRFGRRAQKIPLDAGFSCPNRDGTTSRAGCAFCNERGSGSGLSARGADLAEQWARWRAFYLERFDSPPAFVAYLQSFSNTHGPARKLAAVLEKLAALPGIEGLAVGTRPDCLDADKLGLLAGFPLAEKWLELGLQSADDAVLARVNRGHTAADFAAGAHAAHDAGLLVCAHVIFGLPGESEAGFLNTIDLVNSLPVAGIKFHHLYVCKGTRLARDVARGRYAPPSREKYVGALCRALAILRPDVVVQRLTGDPAPGELAAPAWAGEKRATLAAVERELHRNDNWQGKRNGAEAGPPEWFDPAAPLPRSLE